MLVSWNWLKDYVAVPANPDEVVRRLMMAGLNHESTTAAGDDWTIDLEVTSNRPDCLGHLGIAREISVLTGTPLRVPEPNWKPGGAKGPEVVVRIDAPHLCPRYSARVITGVKVGPSPKWLVDRLAAINVASVNNVVDVTNYVLMECGQPLHAFDLAQLRGRQIIVREARRGEKFVAIDHKVYELEPGMCVIADAESPVAIAGVMGGATSEVSSGTTDLLIEVAEFTPLAVRNTARKLNLHSPSSYRFERGVDSAQVDWASRRCCELIVQVAGGAASLEAVDVGRRPPTPASITFRIGQLRRILGIEVAEAEVARILLDLGLREQARSSGELVVVPPSWRRDLTREIDLVEEVARIHGYDQIPEDVAVPMCPSHQRREDRVLRRVRQVMMAHGLDEAYTASVVPATWCESLSPWTDQPALGTAMSMLKGADRLRVSLIPSLLEARRVNEAVANPVIELFETARIYLPQSGGLPHEQWTLGITSGGDFPVVKGIIEALLEAIHCAEELALEPATVSCFDAARACSLRIAGRHLGWIGAVAPAALKPFKLRGPTTVAEISLDLLMELARLTPQYAELVSFPAVARDINLVMDEGVRWADLAATVRAAGGDCLEGLAYRETYRDRQKDGEGRKRVLFACTFRGADRTLTSEEVDQFRDQIVAACGQRHQAALLA